MWLKTSAEQQFLYGHNVMKSGLGRISESVNRYQGVVLYSMNDLPLVGTNIYLILSFVFICYILILLGVWHSSKVYIGL